MTHFRCRWEIKGGHVHCRLFAGRSRELTHGKCGDFVMQEDEFWDFVDLVKSSIEFVPEHDGGLT